MRKIYLIGGGNYFNAEMDILNKKIASDFRSKKSFLIIPFATNIEKREKWISAVKSAFEKQGIKKFDVLSENLSEKEMNKKISDSELIFFTGGLPEALIDKVFKFNLLDRLKSYEGQIVGFSAGALALSKICFISKDSDYPRSQLIKGLGVVDFTTTVHYEEKELEEISFFSELVPIYTISDISAIIVSSDNITFLGEVNLIKNKKIFIQK
jgi:peptidase E